MIYYLLLPSHLAADSSWVTSTVSSTTFISKPFFSNSIFIISICPFNSLTCFWRLFLSSYNHKFLCFVHFIMMRKGCDLLSRFLAFPMVFSKWVTWSVTFFSTSSINCLSCLYLSSSIFVSTKSSLVSFNCSLRISFFSFLCDFFFSLSLFDNFFFIFELFFRKFYLRLLLNIPFGFTLFSFSDVYLRRRYNYYFFHYYPFSFIFHLLLAINFNNLRNLWSSERFYRFK